MNMGPGAAGRAGARPGRIRRRGDHRVSPVRDTVADLDDAAGDGLPTALPFALVLLVVALPLPLAAYIEEVPT